LVIFFNPVSVNIGAGATDKEKGHGALSGWGICTSLFLSL
jgi:hypothetical protein